MTEPRKPADRARKQAVRKSTTGKRTRVTVVGRAGEALVTVLPLAQWGYAWRQHWQTENFGAWVEDVVDPKDWAAFSATRPNLTDVATFLVSYTEATGEELGESQAS